MQPPSASGPQVCCITALDLINAYFQKEAWGKGVRVLRTVQCQIQASQGIYREAPVAEGRGFHGNEEAKTDPHITSACCRCVDHVYDDQDYPVYECSAAAVV
ncbi:hypothetical protein NCU05556 [Neurospora crassa OR74A]|uniref:Uncharacterized protein n=1 Tax=Neurospora crassa (strain ATCC 24698 / 74-OR23-1A / CBS 708.71 / DSM 1257 / FGSC 987) TaxID=367110 RepID=Q7S707_NEUCR|nr:hypothetical protein NCU05556 [Neurospora crassa OR74A]EAA31282.1 hypothetical protein NCU05556 [Neurospora crassa OR74A]|eukprot:XP_960518.1 hypothetical protein NCU05556 [Neurospora crassa OR74A]